MDATGSRSFKARLKVPKTGTKTKIKVKTNICPGPTAATQKILYRRFWQNLLAEVQTKEKKGG